MNAALPDTAIQMPIKDSAERAFLQIQGLQKAYDAAKPVFDKVDFDIQRGEFVCVIGHSGCGKTTILNVLAGLDTATAGHVFMEGSKSPVPA